ncbi:hypothetical protein V8F20_005346 [Naviculisporaceae sp. PSN 640]
MKLTTTILAGAGLASAAVPHPRPVLGRMSLSKRWDYDVCSNDCSLRNVPMPDKNNFGLPLEGYWSEQCPPLVVGAYDSPDASAVVTWKVKGVVGEPSTWTQPPPTTNLVCDDEFKCKLPFSDILGVPSTTPLRDLMAGMCPLNDREAFIFYLQLSGVVEPVGGGPAVPFVQQYPCTSRNGDRQCLAWDTSYPYIEMAYRCSKCEVAACPSSTSTPPPPPSSTPPPPSSTSAPPASSTTSSTTTSAPPAVKTCGLGTAFGYISPASSTTLDTLSGQGCKRWGWYSSPTLSDLQSGISGILYVGAGGNDISKAVNVGTWSATATTTGKVTVTYNLSPGYTLSEAHVNLKCLSAITKCSPGQYTYKADGLNNLSTLSTTQLNYPSCGSGEVGLIVHGAVNVLTTAPTCDALKAS